jgi:hypothetical protein
MEIMSFHRRMTPDPGATYGGDMGGTLLKIAGIVLAVWFVASVVGAIFSTVKFLFMMALLAGVVVLLVTLLAKSAGKR